MTTPTRPLAAPAVPAQIDEQNAAISARVDMELPRPLGGFEHESDEDAWRAARDARFLALCKLESI